MEGPPPVHFERLDTCVTRLNGRVQVRAELRGHARLPVELLVLGETVAEAGAINVFTVFEHPGGGKCLSHIFFLGVPFACDLRNSDLLIHPSLRS